MLKLLLKELVGRSGYEVRRKRVLPDAGDEQRPIGDMRLFLEDIQARGCTPGGIIDVGANRGDWSRMALSVFPKADVIVIEPQDEMEQHLRQLCVDYPACRYIKAAAGRSEGKLVQTIWDDLAGSSFIPAQNPELLAVFRQRLTHVTTIDRIIQDHPNFRPSLVKLDIQGFEIEALEGGAHLFGITELFIAEVSLFEFMPKQPILSDIVRFMAVRGYEAYDVVGSLRRPRDGALGQLDIAFALRNGKLRASSSWG